MSSKNYNLLLQKLDDFIRKFYFNKLIRGCIYFFSIGLAIFLLAILLEYVGNFSSTFRTLLFYSSITLLLAGLSYFILYPISQLLALGKRISHEQASKIIGNHFQEVDDKLYNVLQLKKQADETPSELIEASINQKIEGLEPIPFKLAIHLGENKRYLKYLAPPLFIILLLAVFNPQIISESTNRLVAHNLEFAPIAPFDFVILNKDLEAYRGEDFNLKVKTIGSEIPHQLYIQLDKQKYLMNKESKNEFLFSFKNIRSSTKFILTDERFNSKTYHLTVLPKAGLVDIVAKLNYPSYLGIENNTVESSGDLTVPEGTEISWKTKAYDADELHFVFQDSSVSAAPSGEDEFAFQKRMYASENYGLTASNKYSKKNDTAFYTIEVIPDLRPTIEVDSKLDSNSLKVFYFRGIAKDDYGFSRLVFKSKFIGAKDSIGQEEIEEIPFDPSFSQIEFYYNWNLSNYNLKAGDKIDYYFEVWDNDGINGAKSSRTATFVFQAPSKDELKQEEEKSNQEIKDHLAENIQLSQEIQRELESLKQDMLNKQKLGYQEKKKLEKLLEKQKQLEKNIQELNKKNTQKNKQQSEYNEMSEEMLRKQEQLERLMEELLTDEMKQMMEEIERLLENLQKDQLQNELDKIELSNEEMMKQMDRNLELFKQLEVEKQLTDAIQKLDEIKEKQGDLKKKTEKADKEEQESLIKEQEELNKEFEELSEDLEKLHEKNEELEYPNDLEDTKALEEEIKKAMEESSNQLSKMKNKDAGKSQEDAGDKMEQLSQSLSQMMANMQSAQHAENLKDLRALLENLIQLSFDQEKVMQAFKGLKNNDPRYVELTQEQRKLQDDIKIIEDSLFALSKRVVEIESIVNKEVSNIKDNMNKAVEELAERRTPQANSRQQFAMASLNNLALMLDEAMQQMQQQMQSMMEGDGECDKPGNKPGSKPGMGNMQQLQQQLNEQMQRLQNEMQGKEKGGQKPGAEGGQGGLPGMSKELAQMAAQQAKIREAIKKMQEEMGQQAGDAGELQRIQDLMEETETDLVNKQITNETIRRQQDILTRLLESEKAEREREMDNKREATEFTDEFSPNSKDFFEYNRQKESEIELLRTLPPSFNPFYKNKVTEYFNKINE